MISFLRKFPRQFVRKYGRPDVITFTNVFAHIEDLKGVIRALKIVAHEGTLIVIENHYLGAIVERNQFDTFYHEHPRTYSLTSFVHIAKSLGMEIVLAEFPKRYGGNIRVFLSAKQDSPAARERLAEVDAVESGFGEGLKQARRPSDRLEKEQVRADRTRGRQARPARRQGIPRTRGDSGEDAEPVDRTLSAAYEKPSSAKIGNYIPGTRIPIRSDDDFSSTSIGVVLF